MLNARAISETHSADGYALSHYAANLHVFGFNRAQSLKEITDGTSQTVFIGEVNDGFRAWGDPLNLRDPTIGLRSPGGFGSPDQGPRESQINFLIGDGSVRSVHADIDPATLRAISTPGDGDRAGEF